MKGKMAVKRICSVILCMFLPISSLLLSTRQSGKVELSALHNSKYNQNIKFSEHNREEKTSASSPLLPQISSSVFSPSTSDNSMENSIEKASSISSDYLSLGINLDDPPAPYSMSVDFRRQRRNLHLLGNTSDTFLTVDSQTSKNATTLLDFKESTNTTNEPCQMCRHRSYLPVSLYNLDTCSYCYQYMRNITSYFANPSTKLRSGFFRAQDPESGQRFSIMMLISADGQRIFANVSDPDERITQSFINKHAQAKWIDCCLAAERCCTTMQRSSYNQSGCFHEEGYCPPTWDGWQCWEATSPAVKAEAFCPPYIYSITEPSSCTSTAVRECLPDGTWFKNSRGQEWTNYGQCGNASVTLQWNRAYVHVAAYYISIIAITPALAIFFAYKQLRVHRIILHQNLFMSMLLNGILVIVFKTTVIFNELKSGSDGPTIISENGIGCRLLFILTKYSRMTNYMWMFCEGFYLHKLIAAAFAEQKSLLVFYIIGWVFPIIPTAVYAGFRIAEANDRCWVVPQESWEWALNGPSLLSLLINVLFLINIIRVLVTKLRAANAQEPSQYRYLK